MTRFVSRTNADVRVAIQSSKKIYNFGPKTLYPFLNNVSVVQSFNLTESIEIEIDMPFAEGIEFLNSEALFRGNSIVVQMGYGLENQTKVFTGTLFDGGSGLTLDANGLSGSITGKGTSPIGLSQNVFPRKAGMTNSEYLSSIADSFSCTIVYLDEVSDNQGRGGTDVESTINSKPSFVINGVISPAQAIKDFCSQYGYQYSFGVGRNGHEVTISSLGFDAVSLSTEIVFSLRGAPFGVGLETDYNEYPIISFSPESTGPLFSRQDVNENVAKSGRTIVQDVGRDGKIKAVSVTPNDSTASATSTSRSQELDVAISPSGSEVVVDQFAHYLSSTNPEADIAEDRAQAIRQNENAAIEYNASLTTVGIPKIKIGQGVSIVGVGAIFEGFFTVKGYTHTWNGGAIETQLSLYSRKPLSLSGRTKKRG